MLEETAHLAALFGVKVVTGCCDVTDEEQVKAFVYKGLSEFSQIDVVANNAGWRARGEYSHLRGAIIPTPRQQGMDEPEASTESLALAASCTLARVCTSRSRRPSAAPTRVPELKTGRHLLPSCVCLRLARACP